MLYTSIYGRTGNPNITNAALSESNNAAANILALQGAIDSMEALGGIVQMPSGDFTLGAGGITPKSGVTINGIRPKLTFDTNCPDLGWAASGGTILRGLANTSDALFSAQKTASSTPINASTSALANCYFSNFAVAEFGYGIDIGAENRLGMSMGGMNGLFFEDIYTEAVRLINPQQLFCQDIKMSKVKLAWHMLAYHGSCAPGNSIINGLYAYLADPANPGDSTLKNACIGILLDTLLATNRTGQGTLNYIHFQRPQINRFGGTIAGSPLIKASGADSATIPVTSCTFIDTDTEGESEYHIELTNTREARVDFSQSGESVGADLKAHIKMRNAKYSVINSTYPDLFIDADSASDPSFCFGFMKGHLLDAASYNLRGLYYCTDESQVNLAMRTTAQTNTDNAGFGAVDKVLRPRGVSLGDGTFVSSGTSSALDSSQGGYQQWTGASPNRALPAGSSTLIGLKYVIKHTGTGTATVAPNGADTIDGANSSVTLSGTTPKTFVLVAANTWITF